MKNLKILLLIIISSAFYSSYCQTNVIDPTILSTFAIEGYDALDHSSPSVPVILDRQDYLCYEEDGHIGGLHQSAITNNTSVN